MEIRRNYALTQSDNTASITASTPSPGNINTIDDESTINVTDDEFEFLPKQMTKKAS